MPNSYENRLMRVLEYIHANPAGDLSLDTLADVAAMSRFHWHRVFLAMTGETCAQAIRRMRLYRAACWLVQTDDPVADVAKRCGYPTAQSFTRAFGKMFGMSPGQFRKRGDLTSPTLQIRKGEYPMFEVEILTAPPRRIAAMSHIGPYPDIGTAFQQLATVFTSRNLWDQARGTLAICYDDPDTVAPSKLRSHAGVIVDSSFEMPEGLESVDVPDGHMAVMHFKGPYAGLKAAYDYLYGDWLAKTGEELRDSPSFEVYLNSPMDTAPDELLTDIYVPLKA
ncbi:AraC family transcriptional regulator [Profundibacter sp.]